MPLVPAQVLKERLELTGLGDGKYLVHGWDLAKATGQDTRLDPALVQACLDVVEPEADIWREAGVFGPKPDLPAGADVQARLLALVGRTA